MIPFTRSSFTLADDELRRFRRDGFLRIKGLLRRELTEYLAAALDAKQVAAGANFDKLVMHTAEIQEVIYGLVADPRFRRLLYDITERRLIYTQHIGLELSPERSGLPWHVGVQSFGFHRKEDYGVSAWIPLTPIDPRRQAGGMTYVPRAVMSGEFAYDYAASLSGFLNAERGEEVFGDLFHHHIHELLRSAPLRDFLEHYREEDAFEVGDIFLFDKYVLHRSVPLGVGPLDSRKAYTIRFIDSASRYDRKRVDSLKVRFTDRFMQDVGERDGEALIDSPLLQPITRRLVGP